MIHPRHVRSTSPRALTTALGLLAAFVVGCGSGGGGGDPPTHPTPSVYGDGQHISSKIGGFYGPAPWEQQSNINSIGCPYPAQTNVYTTGVTVTAVDNWDETGNGAVGTVYVQDTVNPIPQYAGISMFQPSFTPPDLRVLPGDVLDVTGIYEEFPGPTGSYFGQCETLPQIAGSAVFRFDGQVPTPVTITPDALSSYDGTRQYLSMLVTVTNVTIATSGAEKSGRYDANVVVPSGSQWAISDELFDVPHQIPLNAGDTFESVTGIVNFFYGTTLAPRSLADFKKAGSPAPDGG